MVKITYFKSFILLLFLFLTNVSFSQQPKLVLPIGHMFQVEDAFFTENDKYILTYSENVKLWDAFTGKLLKTFENGFKKPQEIDFIAEKGILFIAYQDSIQLINIFNDKILKTFEGNSFSISPDGKTIVVMQFSDEKPSINRNAKLYDLKTYKLLHEFETLIVHHCTENNSFIGLEINKTVIYDASFHVKNIFTEGNLAGISKDFKYLALQKDTKLEIIDLFNNKILKSFPTDQISLYNVRFVPQDNLMVMKVVPHEIKDGYNLQNKDAYLVCFDMTNFNIVNKFPEQNGNLESWSVNSQFVVGSYNDKTIRVWENSTGKLVSEIKDSLGPSKTISFSSDNKFLLTSSNHTAASIWKIDNNNLLRNLESNSSYFRFIKFFKNGEIALFETDNEVWIWDIENGKPIFSVPSDNTRSVDDSMLSEDNSMLFIKTRKKKQVKLLEGNALVLDFEEDNDYRLDVFNTITKFQEKSYPLPINYFRHAINPNGKNAIITCRDSTGYIIDIKSGLKLKNFNKLDHTPEGLFYNKKDNQIIMVGDNILNIYDEITFQKKYSFTESVDIASYGYDYNAKIIVLILANSEIIIRSMKDGSLVKQITDYKKQNGNLAFNNSVFQVLFDKTGNYFAIKNLNGFAIVIIESKTGKKINAMKLEEYPSNFFINDNNNLLVNFKGKLQEFNFTNGKLLNTYWFDTEDINDVKSDMSSIIGRSLTEINVFKNKEALIKYNVYTMPNSNYIITNPINKYYTANQDATKLLHYVTKDLKVITFEQLDVKYNRPDKVLEALGSTDTLLIESYRKAYEKRIKKLGIDTSAFRDDISVPEADFANRDQIEFEQKKETLKLHIKANDSLYKLDRYNVWINEVPIYGQKGISLKEKNSNFLDTTISLKLSQGENRIETSITNVNGIESYRMPLYVKYTPSQPIKEKIYFIGIGIDKFKENSHNLKFCVKDIQDLAEKLKEKYGSDIIIDTLFNENVNLNKIKNLKKKLLTTNVNDKVIIAYSGHGLLSKDFDYFLSTHSVNFNDPTIDGLPYDELENLLDSIPARKKLMLIDACHSGEVDKDDLVKINTDSNSALIKGSIPVAYKQNEKHLGLKNSFELMQSIFVNVGKSTGATIISASAGTQFALEKNDLKNGVFTYSILEALQQHDTLKVSELKNIVGKRVEELTNGLQKPTSRNETISVDWNIWE